jgi:hypothetical protein
MYYGTDRAYVTEKMARMTPASFHPGYHVASRDVHEPNTVPILTISFHGHREVFHHISAVCVFHTSILPSLAQLGILLPEYA